MDLLTYISDMGRREALALGVDTSPDYLWQVATKRRKASHTLARNIEEWTLRHGPEIVSKEGLRPDVWPPAALHPKPKPSKLTGEAA